jgi:hypothetical protein
MRQCLGGQKSLSAAIAEMLMPPEFVPQHPIKLRSQVQPNEPHKRPAVHRITSIAGFEWNFL